MVSFSKDPLAPSPPTWSGAVLRPLSLTASGRATKAIRVSSLEDPAKAGGARAEPAARYPLPVQRDILKIGNPLLRRVSEKVSKQALATPEIQKLIDDMIETMRALSGAGLAAPQIGELVRICVAEVSANERYPAMPGLSLRVWVNPEIDVLGPEPQVLMYEGCLSVPGFRGQVRRPAHIRVRSWDRHGSPQADEFDGALAAVAAHECDHLDGVLFVDRADSRTLCTLDEFFAHVPSEDRIEIVGS